MATLIFFFCGMGKGSEAREERLPALGEARDIAAARRKRVNAEFAKSEEKAGGEAPGFGFVGGTIASLCG